MLKIAIIGAAGFVGTNMCASALKLGHFVRAGIHKSKSKLQDNNMESRHCDLKDEDVMQKFLQGADIVINCAGAVSAANVTVNNPLGPIIKNLELNAAVIDACVRAKVAKLLMFGSSTGYPSMSRPVKEEDMFAGEPASVYEGYGRMRRYIERLSYFVSQKTDTKVCVVRPSAVFGPFDDFGEETSHVIPALIKRAIECQGEFEVWGTGEEIRDFMYIEDFCEACVMAAENYAIGSPINIAKGNGVTIAQIVAMILQILGKEQTKIIFNPEKPTTIPIRLVNVDKAKSVLGNIPDTDTVVALRKTIDWYLEQGD